jgi:hypothetical protein
LKLILADLGAWNRADGLAKNLFFKDTTTNSQKAAGAKKRGRARTPSPGAKAGAFDPGAHRKRCTYL